MASFLVKSDRNKYNEIVLINGLALITNSILVDEIVNKVHLNKLFDYKLHKLKVIDDTTMEIFKRVGIKSRINDNDIYYIGDLNKLFWLKEE